MRYSLLFSLIIFSCSSQQENYRALLEGTWSYEPTAWSGDTITSGLIDTFDEHPTEYEYAIRKLDSGIFLDVYVNEELTLTEECNYTWLTEFRFINDTSGYMINYVLDTANKEGRSQLSTREYLTPREDRFILSATTQDLKLITLNEFYPDTTTISVFTDRIELSYKADEPTTLLRYKP